MADFVCTKTRSTLRNNPFSVSQSDSFQWDGVNLALSVPNQKTGQVWAGVDDELGDMLMIFLTFQDGMNAALWLLWEGYFSKGIVTPRDIYNKWSGDTQEKAAARGEMSNGDKVAKIMDMAPTTVLSFTLSDIKSLAHAMLCFEDSTKVWLSDLENIPIEMYQEAIEYAQLPDAA